MATQAVELLKIANARILSLMARIELQDGILTPAEEAELGAILTADRDALTETAKVVHEMEVRAKQIRRTRREWNMHAKRLIDGLEERAGRFRAAMLPALKRFWEETGKKRLRSHDGAIAVTYRAPGDIGRLEGLEQLLGEKTHARGFALEQVLGSGIPTEYFRETVLYELEEARLKADVDAGTQVPGLTLVHKESIAISFLG